MKRRNTPARCTWMLATAALAASPAVGGGRETGTREDPGRVTFRQTTVTTRVRWEPGAPVELVSVDRGRGTLRLRAGEAVQTLAIVKGAEAGFDALEAGGSLLLSWRFSRDAQPEALLRVLTPDGAVSMVGAPVGT